MSIRLLIFFIIIASANASASLPPPSQFPKSQVVKGDAVLVVKSTDGRAVSLPGLYDVRNSCQAILDIEVGAHSAGVITVRGGSMISPQGHTIGIEGSISVENTTDDLQIATTTVLLRHQDVNISFDPASSSPRTTIYVYATPLKCGLPLFPAENRVQLRW